MNILRKALQIPHLWWDSGAPKPWDSETNLFKKDMMRLIDLFINTPESSTMLKIDVLKEIGNIAYIGGTETVRLQIDLLPHLTPHLKNNKSEGDNELLTQVMRTLSMMVNRNRVIQEKIYTDQEVMKSIFNLIDDVGRVLNSRWGCYLLLNLISDNADAMQKVRDIPNAKYVLITAANINLPWAMWGGNHADMLLKILGFRSITMKTKGDHGTDFGRGHKDKRGRNISLAIDLPSDSSMESESDAEIMEAITQHQGHVRKSVLTSIDT